MTADTTAYPEITERVALRNLRRITLVATVGAFAFGYDTGVISGALPFMELPSAQGGLALTSVQEGLVTAALVLGAAFGGYTAGRVSDRYGRRPALLGFAIVFCLGALGTALAPTVAVMVVARVVLGLAVGGASATVPLFIAELAPADRRGQLVSQNELMIVTGQLVAYTSNAVLANAWDNQAHIWRVMLGIATLPAVILFVGMLFVPESPRWLASHGRMADAMEVLRRVRVGDISAEFDEIEARAAESDSERQATLRDITEPWARRLLWTGVAIGAIMQLTGVNAIMYYAPTILQDTGLGVNASLIATISNGVVSVAATFLGMWLVGRVGRRPLMLTGLTGILGAQIMLGVGFLMPESAVRSYAILVLMLVFLFFQQAMVSVVAWLLIAEIFPLRYRGASIGVATFSVWIANTIVTFAFPILIEAAKGYTFFIFAVVNVASILLMRRILPETQGHSLEEFEELAQTGNIPVVAAGSSSS